MAQLSLYLDNDTYNIVSLQAKAENISISKLAAKILKKGLDEYRIKNIQSLCGALADTDLEIPAEIPVSLDIKRENI